MLLAIVKRWRYINHIKKCFLGMKSPGTTNRSFKMEAQEAPFENTPQASEDTEWFPSLAEYSPGFTKERWLKLLNEPSISHPLWIVALAGFYYAGGEGTCAQIGSMFDTSALRIRGLCTNLSKRIYWKTKCPTYIEKKKKLYWLILFRKKKNGRGASRRSGMEASPGAV